MSPPHSQKPVFQQLDGSVLAAAHRETSHFSKYVNFISCWARWREATRGMFSSRWTLLFKASVKRNGKRKTAYIVSPLHLFTNLQPSADNSSMQTTEPSILRFWATAPFVLHTGSLPHLVRVPFTSLHTGSFNGLGWATKYYDKCHSSIYTFASHMCSNVSIEALCLNSRSPRNQT